MQSIKSKDTIPELIIEKNLKRLKIYSSRNDKRIYGKPDFVFRRKKVVVFIDSDFWHGHPKRFILPKTNSDYWVNKISKNKLRDKDVNRKLKEDGWKVIRLWEYDIKKKLKKCLVKILKSIDKKEKL